MNKKIAALVLTLILIVNIILFTVGITSNLIFWIVIIGIVLIAYFWFQKRKD